MRKCARTIYFWDKNQKLIFIFFREFFWSLRVLWEFIEKLGLYEFPRKMEDPIESSIEPFPPGVSMEDELGAIMEASGTEPTAPPGTEEIFNDPGVSYSFWSYFCSRLIFLCTVGWLVSELASLWFQRVRALCGIPLVGIFSFMWKVGLRCKEGILLSLGG